MIMEKIKTINAEDVKNVFRDRPSRINKGDCGKLLCICGSYDSQGRGMCGAAYFAAVAAYRMGAGLVEIFTPCENYAPLASRLPEAVYSLYEGDEDIVAVTDRLVPLIRSADAVVIGCGLGKSEISRAIVRKTLEVADCPLVLDADALNIISEDIDLLDNSSKEQGRMTVITPHPREMSRLCDLSVDEILNDTVGTAYSFASRFGINCLLKDNKTVITNGDKVYVNQSGNPGMASAGMGDVLAGIIGGILAERKLLGNDDVLYLAALAAYVHGACGDLAAEKIGQYSLLASDIIEQIPSVIFPDVMKK